MASKDNKAQHTDLDALARARFPDLTIAESKLLQTAPKGECAVCGPNLNIHDLANDPSSAETWRAERTIRAGLIRWLCVDRCAKELVDPRGIHVFAAKISGVLDLAFVTVSFPINLASCSLDGELNLRHAEVSAINLGGTWLHALAADGARVENSVFLRKGFYANGQVRFLGARIGGNLECDGGTFENPARLDVRGSGIALAADGAIVSGGVFLRNGFKAVGEVRLSGAQIGGYVDCTNAEFKNLPKEGLDREAAAFRAEGIFVKGSVFLRLGFHSEGEVSLAGARIDGDLDCRSGTFSNPCRTGGSADGVALSADRSIVKGRVALNDGFHADGEVRLLGAQIGGDLDCQGGRFKAPLRTGTGARDRALSAHAVAVEGNAFLSHGFHSEGEAGFSGAQIAGDLDCTGGSIHGEFNLQTASIGGALFWRNIVDPERVRLFLGNASVGVLCDPSDSWPETGKLVIDGLVYRCFAGDVPKDVARRLDWIARQESFAPQPYRQLSKVLRNEGDEIGARTALYEMEKRRRSQADHIWYRRSWSWLLRRTVGYGYYPGRSLLWLLGLVIIGFIFSWGGYAAGSITPTDKDAYAPFKQTSQLPPHYEGFHASIYALENSFPLVKLGQADRWQPDPNPRWECKPSQWLPHLVCRVLSPTTLRGLRWTQICFGWFFTTMGLAAVTGIVRKD